jgi:hypothetical protein
MDAAKANVLQVVSELVKKITYPPADVTESWDADSRKTFKVFRVDVRDIIVDAYECLRHTLTDQFVEYTLHALASSNWLELEAGLFGIISIAESFQPDVDEHLLRLFEHPFFSAITANEKVPPITRRAGLEVVAALDHFFQRNQQFLPQIMPFLFEALAHPATAHNAAKSFASLCSQCRKSLTTELDAFFQMYGHFLTFQTAEEFTKSKVLEGIAAIVQAIDTEEGQLVGVRQLFAYIAQDAMQAINVTKGGGDAEQGQVLALTTLKCLASTGRALAASDEDYIDLENDNPRELSTFWSQGPGKEIQNQVINFVNYLTSVFPGNDEIIESACNVLRTAFKETFPGPFVLPISATVDFVSKTTLHTPRLPYVLETACCWLSRYRRDPPEGFPEQARRILHHCLSIMQTLQHPSTDPEISVGCIELIQNFMISNPQVLTQEDPANLAGMFGFTIESIKSPEVLPKRAAAKLWKDIFEQMGNTSGPHQGTAQEIGSHFGPAITLALMSNVCGEVDFTSLEHIMVPLRAMIKSDRNARTNITNALAQQPLLQRYQQDTGVQDLIRKLIESLSR